MLTDGRRDGAAQNCDVIETTRTGAVIYSFNNYGRGTAPCRLQIRNDGTLAIYDSLNVLLNVNAAPARPVSTSGQILTGQDAQDVRTPAHYWVWASVMHALLCYAPCGVHQQADPHRPGRARHAPLPAFRI